MSDCLIGTATIDAGLNTISLSHDLQVLLDAEDRTNLGDYIDFRQIDFFRNTLENLAVGEHTMICVQLQQADGSLRWSLALVYAIESGGDRLFKITFQDPSSLEQIAEDSALDPGTGLLNKKAITELAKLRMQEHPDELSYLCIVNIDNFRELNERFGHLFGDEVLLKVVEVIRASIRNKATAGRIGADEFLIITEGIETKEDLRTMLRDIRTGVADYYREQLEGDLYPTTSIGAVLFPLHAATYEDAFYVADRMLYRAKEKGKDRYIIYVPELHGDVLHSQEIPDFRTRSVRVVDRTTLFFRLIDELLCNGTMTFPGALALVASNFGLDELYIFYGNRNRSAYGFISDRVREIRETFSGQDAASELPYADGPAVEQRMDYRGICIFEDVGALRTTDPEAFAFLHSRGFRSVLLYRMSDVKDGYAVFYRKTAFPRRTAAVDMADLTRIAKIFEASLKRR